MKNYNEQAGMRPTNEISVMLHDAYSRLPNFTDIFDEEGFYLAFIALTIVSILTAIVASRYITLREADI